MSRKNHTRQYHIILSPAVLCITALLVSGCSRSYEKTLQPAEHEIASIINLAGYEYTYREIIHFGEESSLFGFRLSDKGFLASVDIRLVAGYDLTEGFDISVDNFKQVRVYLPPPRILSVDADESSIREYFSYQRGKELTHMDIYRQIESVKPVLIEDAIQHGIMQQVEENVHILVGRLLLSLGFDKVMYLHTAAAAPGEGIP